MKIHELDLTNVTRYKQAHMDLPSKISVLLGHNAEGKTTILDAIALGLTGACDRTDRAGKGQEQLVTTGQKQGAIKLTVSSNGAEPLTVTRYVPGELAIEGQHGNKTQLQANLCEYLGTDVGALSAALSTTAFIDAKPSDEKGLLFGLLQLKFDRANIIDQVMMDAVDENTLEVQAQAMERILKAAPANLFTGEASTFDLLHKHVYQLRRDYKRDLKNLGEPEQPKLGEAAPPIEELLEHLHDLQQQRNEKQLARQKIADVDQIRIRLQLDLDKAKELLPKSGDPETAKADMQKVLKKLEALKSKRVAAFARSTATQEALTGLASGRCAYGADLIPCGLTKQKSEKVFEEMRRVIKQAEEEYKTAGEEQDGLEERINELSVEADKVPRALVEAGLKEAEADLANLQVPEGDPQVLADEISELTQRVQTGEQVISAANREEGARQERKKQQEKRAGLEQTWEVLDALVKVLEPSGLPGKILSQTIGPIEERANARLQELTGGRYSLHLVLDPDFAILVDHDGVTTDLKRLSSSERFRVGVILQEALVSLTGLRFLIVDNVELLDSENRMMFMDLLLSMAPEMDQIIVLSTIGPLGATNPHIDDLALYVLEDGQLEEIA